MNLHWLTDNLWMTRSRALELGYTHEGTHFGVPVFCEYDERDEDTMGMVVAKTWFLEWVIDVGAAMLQFANQFREPGEELWFPFLIRPIPVEVKP